MKFLSVLPFLWMPVYGGLLVTYLIVEVRRPSKAHRWCKIFLAACYWLMACLSLLKPGAGPISVRIWVLAGLSFCFAGDIVLIDHFTLGAMIFALGNLLLICADQHCLGQLHLWSWTYLRTGILFGALAFICAVDMMVRTSRFDTKKRLMGAVYLLIVSIQGMMGLILFLYAPLPGIQLFGLGMVLFMASDYVLACRESLHPHDETLLRLNSLLYFTGMGLAAYSLWR